MKTSIILLSMASLILTGCASQKSKITRERGWIGGGLATAKPAGFRLFDRSLDERSVSAFPAELRKEFKGGVLLLDLDSSAPLARAGLAEGDLILKINQQLTPSQRAMMRLVDSTMPG